MAKSATIEIENVNVPGRVTRVDGTKYAAMRRVLLRVLPKRGPGITQAQMRAAIQPELPAEIWPGGAKSTWWMKTVQLDLEAKGLIVRDPSAKPLRWRRA